VNRFLELSVGLLGLVAAVVTPAIAADLSPAIVAALNAPAVDDATGLAGAITVVLTANPGLGADVAGYATRRSPENAAVIATAAVNADPNAALEIIRAVLAALPDKDKGNDVLTGSIMALADLQPPNAPGPGHYPDAPLVATWTDPPKSPRVSGTQLTGPSTPNAGPSSPF
jgi:hypothetical protein